MNVTWQTTACRAVAERLADRLHLPLSSHPGCHITEHYSLFVTETHLELVYTERAVRHRVFVEFLRGSLRYRCQKGGGKNQAIARAVGLKAYKNQITILDATAGLASDAFLLAYLGCRVDLVERSPVIAALVEDGMRRARENGEMVGVVGRMHLTLADAKEVLYKLKRENYPDVIYLDPMFPTNNKNALTKMEMRIIRDIVGKDLDAEELMIPALLKARKRVVVKRPRVAPALQGAIPNFSIEGKRNRYDVYLTEGIANIS